MSNKLKIALLPYDIVAADKEENLVSVATALNKVSRDTDLVILPETFTTGFIKDRATLSALAETNTGRTVDDLHRWAGYFGFAIAGSFVATDGASHFYNRAFLVEPSGDEAFYDKHHLFSMGGENELFSPGDRQSPTVRFRGWNIRLAVCYDLRFPTWCRNRWLEYDLLIFPANWPHSRIYAFRQLLIARAIENQAYVAGCNRSGADPYGEYPLTDSFVVDNRGAVISKEAEDGIIYAILDHDRLIADRERFPVYRDSDYAL